MFCKHPFAFQWFQERRLGWQWTPDLDLTAGTASSASTGICFAGRRCDSPWWLLQGGQIHTVLKMCSATAFGGNGIKHVSTGLSSAKAFISLRGWTKSVLITWFYSKLEAWTLIVSLVLLRWFYDPKTETLYLIPPQEDCTASQLLTQLDLQPITTIANNIS